MTFEARNVLKVRADGRKTAAGQRIWSRVCRLIALGFVVDYEEFRDSDGSIRFNVVVKDSP